jgi:hypothetical protein
MKKESIIHRMIAEASKEKNLISIEIYGETLLFERITNSATIFKVQRDAINECKTLKKIPSMKEKLEGLNDEIICYSILFTQLNRNEEKQTLEDFLILAREAGPVFNTIISTMDFLMKPQGAIEAELVEDVIKN